MWTEFSFLSQLFLVSLTIVAWEITTTNLICQVIDFQGTCDPCCYSVLLLRLHVWKRLALLGAKSSKNTFGSKVELQLQKRLGLEGTLLAAGLRSQRPESESLSWLCLLPMWIEAQLVIMRFLRTQIGNCRTWLDWKCSGLLPLVVLALSRPEKALQWLLSQILRRLSSGFCLNSLDIPFVESVNMSWKDWP